MSEVKEIEARVEVESVPVIIDEVESGVTIENIDNAISTKLEDKKIVYRFVKRIMDIVLSLIAIVVLSPVLIIVMIAIRLESKGRAIFRQDRIGINKRMFKMYKFRSMVKDAEKQKNKLMDKNEMDGPMFKMKEDPRVTKVGKFIRKTSIDELPQLINILKGEMSIVGPRPSLPEEVEKFEPWMMKRLSVKPGLTCYWQVSGRNSVGFEKWMKLDLEYVEKRCLKEDVGLIFSTFRVFLGDKDGG